MSVFTEESILFRSDFNVQNISFTKPKPITIKAISKAITQLWIDVGMKKQRLESDGYKRNEIMRCHGMRKFFETNAFKAGMDLMRIRRLMGQKSSLEDSYLKLTQEDLLEGDSKHVGYVDVIDQLTIDETHKLKREVQMLKQLTGKNIEAKLNEKEKRNISSQTK